MASHWKSVLQRARREPGTCRGGADGCLEGAPKKTLYDLIGARAGDDAAALKKAFRSAARAYHPDLHPEDPDAPFRFRQIVAANSILRDAEQRAVYDELLQHSNLREVKPPATYDQLQQLKRGRHWSKTTRTTVAVAVIAALVGGYGLLAPLPTTAVIALIADMDNARGPDETTGAQLMVPTNPAHRDEPEALGGAPAPEVVSRDVDFYRKRAIAAYRSGDFPNAIIELDEAIRLDPNDVKAYNIRGNAFDEIGAFESALADYDQAIRIDPNNPAVFRDRAILWRRQGALDKALVDLDRAIRFSFGSANLYCERGVVWSEKGRRDRALADFSRAAEIDLNFVTAYLSRDVVMRHNSE
ncbi:MAG TPA: tetratricopeptide repeat protein [Xanthobacteraceae bacterium]|nr:tetratricopeptide repeat protein [Xanthobacteraceae bacterium]